MLTIGEDFYLIADRPAANEFVDLRAAVGWTEPPHDVAERALANSLHVVCLRLRSDDQLVGFGRITGDRAMRFYIEDVAILPEFQGRGLGRAVMDALVSWLDENVSSSGKTYLMAAEHSVRFYEHYGFKRRRDDEPGMWRHGRA